MSEQIKKQFSLGQVIKLAEKVENWKKWYSRSSSLYRYGGSFNGINFEFYKDTGVFNVFKIKSYKISAEKDDILLTEYKVKAKDDLRLKELCQNIEFYVKKQKQDEINENFNSIKEFVKEGEIKIENGKIKLSLDAMIELAEKVENWRISGVYRGSIKNNKGNIDILIDNSFLPIYEIRIRHKDITVGSCFSIMGKNKSKVKKLCEGIKSKYEQQKRDSTKNAFNCMEDLLKEVDKNN